MKAMAIDPAKLPDDIQRAIAFLSRIPVPSRVFADAGGQAADAAHAYALAGIAIALPAALLMAVLTGFGAPPLLAAACTVAGLVVTTGALHEDGLADTADGFFGGNDREARLAIMKDSANGSYATLALVLSQAIRIAALAALLASGLAAAVLGLLLAAAVSRTAMAWMWSELEPARPGGVSAGAGRPSREQVLLSAATAVAAGFFAVFAAPQLSAPAVFAAGAAAAVAYGFSRLSADRIGGQTGDTLGAVQQLGEIAFLAVLAMGL